MSKKGKRKPAVKSTPAVKQRKKAAQTGGRFTIEPVFRQNYVAVVFQTSNLFCPYAAVTIQSLIETATKQYNYDVIVTSLDINEENAMMISKMADGIDNISIRVFNISKYRAQHPLTGNRRFGSETWTRVFLADMMPNYSKVIDLDSDMILRRDIGELYRTDVSQYYLAGVQDLFVFYSYYGSYINGKFKTHLGTLGLTDPRDYVNAGCLIFNLDKIRNDYPLESILEVIKEKNFEILEQDTFNYMFRGHILHLDMSWNYLVDSINITGYADKNAPEDFKVRHDKAAQNIKLIHYAAPDKPWDHPENPYAIEFWETARHTAYYSTLLQHMIGNQQKRLALRVTKLEPPAKRKALDKLLPKGSKRRETVKKLAAPFRKKK